MSAAEYFARIEKALQTQPYHLELLSAWAQFSVMLGRGEQAIEHLEKLRQDPNMTATEQQSQLCLVLGNLYFESGHNGKAGQFFAAAIELNQQQTNQGLVAGLWNNLGQTQHRMHQLDAAKASYQQSLSLNPQSIEAMSNLGALYLDLGQTNSARHILEASFAVRQDYAPAWVNLGILEGLSQNDEAAQSAFAQAQILEPKLSEPWLEAVFLLIQQKKYPQAQLLCQQGIQALKQSADLEYLNQRLSLIQHQKPEAQRDSLALNRRHFRQLQSELGWCESHFLNSESQLKNYLAELQGILDRWQGKGFKILNLIPELRYLPELLFGLLYIGYQSHRQLRQSFADLFQTTVRQFRPKQARSKLKIGVLISPQHEGIFQQLGWPLIQQLREQFDWVLVGNQRKLQSLDQPGLGFINHLEAFAQSIQAQDFDLLYYWEAGSDCINYFLPFFRLAPVQFMSWGMPLTSGIPAMDYMISSALVESIDAQQDYSERLLLHPILPSLASHQNDEHGTTRQQLGLPLDCKLYVCMQNPLKYCQDFIEGLKAIVRLDSDALLVLLSSDRPWIQAKLTIALKELDFRIHWIQAPISQAKFNSYLKLADLVLDTHKVSGGQTADQTILLGSPLVSFPGRTARSRLSLARLKALGDETGISTNWHEFTRKACELAHEGPLRQRYQQNIQKNAARSLQDPAIATAFADLIYQMAKEKGRETQQ